MSRWEREEYESGSPEDKDERLQGIRHLNEPEDKCCFCGTQLGALVKLHQGWGCIDCFQKLLDSHEKDRHTKE